MAVTPKAGLVILARRGILEAREIQLDGVGNRQRLFLSNIKTHCRNRIEEKKEKREEGKKNQSSFSYDTSTGFVSPLEETSEFFAMTIFLRRKAMEEQPNRNSAVILSMYLYG